MNKKSWILELRDNKNIEKYYHNSRNGYYLHYNP